VISLNYAFLLPSDNLRALLRVIRDGESSQLDTAYYLRYHPTIFPYYFEGTKHPRALEPLKDGSGRQSSAAGAYQFTMTTWDEINEEYGLEDDMSPYSQDCHAVALIHKIGALDLIIDGHWERAVVLCAKRWASLPDSPLADGGHKMSWDRVRRVYEKYGGMGPGYVVSSTKPQGPYGDEQPPAPIEERSTNTEVQSMGPALLIPLIASLAEVFSPLLRGKLSGALDKQVKDPAMSQQMAGQIMDIVKQAVAQSGVVPTPVDPAAPSIPVTQPASTIDPVIAVGAVKASPLLQQQVEQQLNDYFDRMAPVLDRMEKLEQASWAASEDSMDRAAARARSEPDTIGQPIMAISAALVALLVVFACGIAAWQVYQNGSPTTEVWAQIAGLIGFGTGVWVTIVSYRYGSSRTSQTKDFAIAELSTRRSNV
jgi:muramidase (phage lysozyme)